MGKVKLEHAKSKDDDTKKSLLRVYWEKFTEFIERFIASLLRNVHLVYWEVYWEFIERRSLSVLGVYWEKFIECLLRSLLKSLLRVHGEKLSSLLSSLLRAYWEVYWEYIQKSKIGICEQWRW